MKNESTPVKGRPPLLCWDIFMEGYARRTELADDLIQIKKISKRYKWSIPLGEFENELIWRNKTLIITDPQLVIVHATRNIFDMTGYNPVEVIGKTPKIFQGMDTETEKRELIKEAIDRQKSFDIIITNYKKDDSPYQCHIESWPVFNNHRELVHYIAVEYTA